MPEYTQKAIDDLQKSVSRLEILVESSQTNFGINGGKLDAAHRRLDEHTDSIKGLMASQLTKGDIEEILENSFNQHVVQKVSKALWVIIAGGLSALVAWIMKVVS